METDRLSIEARLSRLEGEVRVLLALNVLSFIAIVAALVIH